MRVTVRTAHILDEDWWEQFRESLGEGIGYWASEYRWGDSGLTVVEREGGQHAVTWQELGDAAGTLSKRFQAVWDGMLDAGDLDPDVVDLIVQQACLSEIVYG